MKLYTSLLTLLIFLSVFNNAKAQVEINPYGGYFFKATIEVEEGKANVKEAPFFGLNVSVPLEYSDIQFDFTYERQATDVFIDAKNDSGMSYLDTLDISFNYFLIGAVYEIYSKKSKFIPYGGINAGVCIINETESQDKMYPFSFGLKGGVKYFLSKRIGFKIQSQLNLMLLTQSSNFGCAITTAGSACGLTISSPSSVGQFGFTGGIIFKL